MTGRGKGVRDILLALAVLAVLAIPVASRAQQGEGTAAAPAQKAWAGDWNAGVAEGQARDEVSGETVVIAAYGALWLVLIVFVLRIQSLVGGLRRESAELKTLVESRFPESGKPGTPGF